MILCGGIVLIIKEVLFKTIDKDICFQLLAPIVNENKILVLQGFGFSNETLQQISLFSETN